MAGQAAGIQGGGRFGVRPAARRRAERTAGAVGEALLAYLYLSPALILLLVFVLGPFLYVFYASALHAPGAATQRFVGLENYRYLLDPAQQAGFWQALTTTCYYVAGVVPAGILLSLACALLLHQVKQGRLLFRLFFFLPYVTPTLSTSIIWLWVFNPQFGLLNYLLGLVHVRPIGWVDDPHWAMPAVIIYSLWQAAGFKTVVFLAGLSTIPRTIQEAAQVDGAGRWAVTRHVTAPLLTPTIFFVLIISVIEALKVFTQIFALTGGGPAGATTTIGFFLYQNAFQYFHLDVASAVAVLLFILIMAATLLQSWAARHWVFYG